MAKRLRGQEEPAGLSSKGEKTEVSTKSKIFNDPIHGQIELPDVCVKIVDTPEFQRLRYIRQLGGVYLVYPGATHTRFEHSLGVCHLAGEMVKMLRDRQRELEISDDDVLCVQVAGLCHDLGHGPFSHVFENMVIPAILGQREWKHETQSVKMFDYLLEKNGIRLHESDQQHKKNADFITELIGGCEGKCPDRKQFLFQIVNNKKSGIDVDKWDYFERDCHGLGLKNIFQPERLMKSARVIQDPDSTWNICFRDKDVLNVYDMFYTRENLHRRAYKHKVVVAIERMIADALLAHQPHIDISNMAEYTRLNDQILFSGDQDLPEKARILKRIQERDLYVFVGKANIKFKEKFYDDLTKAQYAEERKAKEDILGVIDDLEEADKEKAVFVHIMNFDYGMKYADPVAKVKFYTKDKPNTAITIPRDQVSHMLPGLFQDKIVYCYCRDSDNVSAVKNGFEKWKENRICAGVLEA